MVECDGKILKLTLQWGNDTLPFISFTKTFKFCIDDTVWIAKQAVLLEFASLNLSDPLNYGFYMPPYKGKAGKFLDEERLLRDYPSEGYGDHLEFRYKRRIYRSVDADERKLQKYQNKAYQKKFLDQLLMGNLEKSKRLLEKGLDPNFQDERTGETPLTTMAASPNSSDACMLLVNYGAYLDYRSADGMTSLHKAIIHDRPECTTCLLDLGASPNYKDAKGLTPLYHGILAGTKADYCEFLLNEKALIGIGDHQGSQEIHQACRNGLEAHLDHLIFYGANVNSQTASGNTPLHICAIANQENCARLLLFRGADKSLCNYSHQTAYEVAVIACNDDVANVIDNFDSNDVTLFNQKPIYSRRRRKNYVDNKASNSLINENIADIQRTSTLPTRFDLNSNKENMFLKSARKTSKSIQGEKHEVENKTAIEEDDSVSDYSDSDEETNKHNRIDRRTFSSTGVGSRRTPAPIKSIQGANVRNRLYQSIPGRQFIATVDYHPKAPGELLMEKDDIVELLYIGELGFWEGRVKDKTGWFPSACVEELKKTNKKAKNRTWFGKKSGQKETIQKAIIPDKPIAKIIQLKRGERGYGFQLRGANSHMARIEFTPSPQFPALQYIGEVDKGEAAEKVGLKPGDFILEVNGEDVKYATHGHVVSLVANSGKSLTLKVITVAAEGLTASLANESLTAKSPIYQNQIKTDEHLVPSPLPRSQYTSLTMGPSHKLSSTGHDVPDSPSNVATVITLDKKVQRKRSVKSMWTDTALKLNQPDGMISEEISKGVIRRSKGLSMNISGDIANSDTDSGLPLRSNSISSRSSSCSDMIDSKRISATLPRRYSRTNSQESEESDNRTRQPPNYEDTLENMRRIGRKPSIKYTEKETTVNQPDMKPCVQNNNNQDDVIVIPSIPLYSPPAPPERNVPPKTPVRSVSVPETITIDQHTSLGRSSSEPGHLSSSSDEDEPSSDFAKNLLKVVAARDNRMRNRKYSIDDVINIRKKEQNLGVIKENEEAKKPFNAEKMTKSPSSDAILQNIKGSDSLTLYTASSTSSLDTQYSKDSGIDVSEVMTQTPGEQPPDLASALANAVAKRAEKMIDINTAIEQTKQQKVISQEKSFPSVVLKSSSVQKDNTQTISQLIKRNSSNVNEVDKTPPPTRPKPKKSTESLASNDSNSTNVGNISDQLDGISIISSNDLVENSSKNEESNKHEIVTPPIMFASFNDNDPNKIDDLPPPPSDFVNIASSINDEKNSVESQARANAVGSDPPPPYSPPRVKTDVPECLSEKPFIKWTAEDVGEWLDFIKMGQYKESFIENDIQGMHLSELSKDDLSELGVKKLGHRLTIDDSIGKLRRNQQLPEV